MKKLVLLLAIFGLLLTQSCEDPQAPESKLTVAYDTNANLVKCQVSITDDHGCKYFSQQGIVYAFYNNPVYTDETFASVHEVNKATQERTFQFAFEANKSDTTYYIRAYVKSNYGTGYSNTAKIVTMPDTGIVVLDSLKKW
ncbi:MAG: hypothetical protein LBK03_03375 [Bacteroidales bacterium]|jgi:hypothetical protein|nr:hypothetical protein [Bacteroidales bacterium]